jgi:outer membrane receptor protein involved in Fe transport
VGDQRNYTDLTFSEYEGGNFRKDELTRRSVRDELEKEKEGDHELNINYEKTFGDEEHKLTALLQGRNSVEVEDASLVETEGLPWQEKDTVLFQNSLNKTDVVAYLGKVDYTWPFSEEGKLQTGIRAEQRTIENVFNVEQRPSESDPWTTLDQFSNTFNYEEAIYGAYVMYSNELGKFDYQGGLRYEFTGISTELKSEGQKNERSYSNLFPSLSLSYELNDTTSLQVSYSRRLDRPYFRELNPYNTFNNNRVYSTGNPNLDPEFTGAYDAGFVHYHPGGSFYLGAFYRRTTNEIEDVDTIDDGGVTIVKPYNLASRENIGIETRYSKELTDWWNISLTANFFRGSTYGEAAGEDLQNSSLTMDGQIRMDIDVKDWFKFQTNAEYRAPEREGQDVEKAMYEINAGVRKSFLDNRGNISFSVRDMFNTDIYRSRTDASNFTARRQHQWRIGPFYSLSISYKLKDEDARADQGSIFGRGEG